MGLAIEWQDEEGRCLAEFEGGFDGYLHTFAPASSACLRFIDPYGDTTFNQVQLGVLIEELQAVRESLPPGEQRSYIEALLTFLDEAYLESQTYVKFIGE